MPADTQQGGQLDLTGTMWSLSILIGRELVAGSAITTELTSDGKISGSSGCNLYTGGYSVNGNSFMVSWLLSSRTAACSQEIMNQEIAYLETLAKTRMFTASRDQLTLKDADGNQLMIFSARTQDLAGVMDQEAQYPAALETATTYKIAGQALELHTADGALAVDYTN